MAEQTGGLSEYVGPYESWGYGKGRGYGPPAVKRGDIAYLTALAEGPANSLPEGITSIRRADGSEVNVWLPTLWRDNGRFKPRFFPFVLQPETERNQNAKAMTIEALRSSLGACSHAFSGPSSSTGATFQVNVPVESAAMNPGFKPAGAPKRSPAPARMEGREPVVVAVIDDGIPFAHHNLRDSAGKTRVEFCWLQSARAEPGGNVLFGREFTSARIDDLIGRFGADEDILYREAGSIRTDAELPSALGRHASHGAHVLDLAAGMNGMSGSDPSAMDDVRIIAVELPNTLTWDTSGFGKDACMLAAFHYIFDRADIIMKRYGVQTLPLIVNFSYGFSGGPHDGTSQLEAAIDELVRARRQKHPTLLVMPSGNMFSDSLHCVVQQGHFKDGRCSIGWRIQPNDRTSSYLELWFPDATDIADFGVSVSAPGMRSEHAFEPAFTIDGIEPEQMSREDAPCVISDLVYAGKVVGQVSVDKHRNLRWRVLIALAPTEPEDSNLPAALAGLWDISVSKKKDVFLPSDGIQCWIQRDTSPQGYETGARQSYFDDPENPLYSDDGTLSQDDADGALVRRFGSLSGLATGASTLVVAGFVASTGKPAIYSSAGALRKSAEGGVGLLGAQVDYSAMSDRAPATPGVVAAGTRSGSYAVMNGTSVAAPQVARHFAANGGLSDDTPLQVEIADRNPLLQALKDRARLGRRIGPQSRDEPLQD
jgi:hypothetical protein